MKLNLIGLLFGIAFGGVLAASNLHEYDTIHAMLRLDEFLTVKEAAEFLGVSPNTVRNWGREGKIPEHRHPINNYRLYRREDLESLLKQLQQPSNRKAKAK